MSKARVIGPSSAGSTIHGCNVHLNTAGGTKKQGLPFQLDRRTFQHRAVKRLATGDKRDYIFTMNQIGGIGRVGWYPRDGIRPRAPYQYGFKERPPTYTSSEFDPANTNANVFVYTIDGISYIILPVVLDTFISLIEFKNGLDTIVFSNVKYDLYGPTNGHTGYVFRLKSTIPDASYTILNTISSQLNPITLLLSDAGSITAEVNNFTITFTGNIPSILQKIIYDGTSYDIVFYQQLSNSIIIVINGMITITNGYIQFI
jgi:hypothetical protein